MESYQQGAGHGREGERVQRVRTIISWYKIDRGNLRTVWKMNKPKTCMYDPWTLTKAGE